MTVVKGVICNTPSKLNKRKMKVKRRKNVEKLEKVKPSTY